MVYILKNMRKKTNILLGIFGIVLAILGGLLYYSFVYYPTIGSFGVITNPIAAQIYINDELIGESPVEFKRTKGVYSLRAEKEGYVTNEREIEVVGASTDVVGILLESEERPE